MHFIAPNPLSISKILHMKIFSHFLISFFFSICIFGCTQEKDTTIKKLAINSNLLSIEWEEVAQLKTDMTMLKISSVEEISPEIKTKLKTIGEFNVQYTLNIYSNTNETKQTNTVKFLREISIEELGEIAPSIRKIFMDRKVKFIMRNTQDTVTVTGTI
jgi:hypothetical protein